MKRMICDDLLYMDSLSGLKLVSGENGLHRTIRWLYFADTQEFNTSYKPSDWIHGGELVVLTSEKFLSDVQRTKDFIIDSNEKDIAGLIIQSELITSEVIDITNEMNIPLFALPWSIKSVDLSQIICKALIEEEQSENTLDRILGSIVYSDGDNLDGLIYQAIYYGFDLRKKSRIAVFDLDNFKEYLKENKISSEAEINSIMESFRRIIKNSFIKNGIEKIMTFIQGDSIIILFPTGIMYDKGIQKTVADISISLKSLYPGMKLTVGVGNCYNEVDKLKRSFEEAIKTIEIGKAVKLSGNVWFYKNMGFYSLLFYVKDEVALRTYYKNILEDLQEYDMDHSTDMLNTLEEYINCNLNMKLTSESLFIHRNTLRYRLDKIEDILCVNLTDIEDVSKLSLAFAVKKYLDNIYMK